MALYALFLCVVPLLAHGHFSGLGFNPTDDGFYLAFSRRLLEGQTPHRDFITVRPVGSAILHLPFVLLGGDHVFLISRLFVWFQFAWIALAWTRIASRLLRIKRDPVAELLIATIAFALCCHYFPVMVWSTIDGLFLSATGLLLCLGKSRKSRALGYFLIGAAYVCKQNFAVLAPMAIVLLGHRRSLLAWVSVASPGLGYVAAMAIMGALPDMCLQLASRADFVTPGFLRFIWEYATAWGMLSGFVAGRLLWTRATSESGQDGARTRIAIPTGLLAITAAVLAASFSMGQGRFLYAPSFGLFGMALGATLQFGVEGDGSSEAAPLGLLIVVSAWCAALSIGYNTPALATGLCVIYLLSLARITVESVICRAIAVRSSAILAIMTGLVMANFISARKEYVYLDRPAKELSFPLDDVLPGGKGLRTNKNTYAFLADLNKAIVKVSDPRYAILPDLAAYWVKSNQVNPLPMDWDQWVDLGNPELLARVTDSLATQRGSLTVIVQKVQAANLAKGFTALPESDRYAVAAYVRRHFTQVGETEFFTLYR